MAKIDAEVIEGKLIDLVKDNLAAKVTAINAEKADGVSISNIADSEYYTTFRDRINNSDPFIFYGYDNLSVDGIGPSSKKTFRFFCFVIFSDVNPENDGDFRKKLFRYSRIITEIFEENCSDFGMFNPVKVIEYAPSDFALNENSPVLTISGAVISGAFAS